MQASDLQIFLHKKISNAVAFSIIILCAAIAAGLYLRHIDNVLEAYSPPPPVVDFSIDI